jgi:hypothetical protein
MCWASRQDIYVSCGWDRLRMGLPCNNTEPKPPRISTGLYSIPLDPLYPPSFWSTYSHHIVSRWNLKSSGMWCCVSGEWIPPFWKITVSSSLRGTNSSQTAWPRRWGYCNHLKHHELHAQWHSVTSQKTWILSNISVRTSSYLKVSVNE